MKKPSPSSFFISGALMVWLSLRGFQGDRTSVLGFTFQKESHVMVISILMLITGMVSISHGTWLAAKIARGKGQRFGEYINESVSTPHDGMSVKDLLFGLGGGVLSIVVIFAAMCFMTVLVWILLRIFYFAT